MQAVQALRVWVLLFLRKYRLCVLWLCCFCDPTRPVHARWTGALWLDWKWAFTFGRLLWLVCLHHWLDRSRSNWLFPPCASAKHCSLVFFNLILLLFILTKLNINQVIRCQQKRRLDCLQVLVPDSRLPFCVFHQNFHNFHWMLLFENIKSFVVCHVLFWRLNRYSGQLYPEFCLQRWICFLYAADCMQFVLALFRHENHLGLPEGFLQIFRHQSQQHVSHVFTSFKFIVFKWCSEIKFA